VGGFSPPQRIPPSPGDPTPLKGLHPLYCRSSHAELRAITKAGRIRPNFLAGTILYVARISEGRLSMALPCQNCLSLISFVGVEKIVYTDWDGRIRVARTRDLLAEEREEPD
jgi:deoxycytidylate deaminase